MRKILVLLVWLTLALTGCFDFGDDGSGAGAVNVEGIWRAPVTFLSCAPVNVCSNAGFTQGTTVNAIMTLTQNGNDVEGSYTYEGAGIDADVSGSVRGGQLVIDGRTSNPLGSVTVYLTGPVANNHINASISHRVTLIDGRSATVSASGDFSR